MWNCEKTQELLLEHLYGLLEASDQVLLLDHARTCPECSRVLEKTIGQKEMLSRAARREFPGVKFVAPQEKQVIQIASRPPRFKTGAWVWATAAAALVVLGLTGGVIAIFYQADLGRAGEFNRLIAQANDQAGVKNRELSALMVERNNKLRESREEIRKKELKVVVSGPQTIMPGAPNQYQVLTRDTQNRPVEARVDAYVEDQANPGNRFPVVARGTQNGALQLTIPPDLPLKASSKPTLIVSARRESGTRVEVKEGLQLASTVYVAHVATDKPMYQPGETVHYRSLIMERFNLRPAQEDFALRFFLMTPLKEQKQVGQGNGTLVRMEKPQELLNGPDGKPLRGLGAGSFQIAPDAPGGEYSLIVRDIQGRFPEQTRKFIVNRYQKPRINKELDFHRKSYGPNQEMIAHCKAASADGKPLANTRANATLVIDGVAMGVNGKPSPLPAEFQTDAAGRVSVKFLLPSAIQKGDASLSVSFQDGGNIEAISKPVPIVVDRLNLEFFPEGGDLVAGLPSRVYFQAQTPLGKPAEVVARLLENGKEVLADVRTLSDDREPGINQGMGRFEITPVQDGKYELEILQPASVKQKFLIGPIKPQGTVLRMEKDAFKAGEKVGVHVRSTGKNRLMVGLYCRGRLLESAYIDGNEGACTLNPQDPIGGVCRLTVFEEKVEGPGTKSLVPVAERLFYRSPAETLQVQMTANKQAYVPGDHASIKIFTRDEKSQPVGAVVMVGVVDRSVVVMADEKTARSMPTHFLLTTEVRKPQELEFADVLIGGHPKAPLALDLLLGTQGWRRFAEQDPAKFRRVHEEEAANLLVTIGQASTQSMDLSQAPVERLAVQYETRVVALQEEVRKAQSRVQEEKSSALALAAFKKMDHWKDFFNQMKVAGFWLLVVGIFAVAMFLAIQSLRQQAHGKLAAAMVVSVCGLLLAFLAYFDSGKRTDVMKHPQFAMKGEMQPNVLLDDPKAEVAGWRAEAMPLFAKPDAPKKAVVTRDGRMMGLMKVAEAPVAPGVAGQRGAGIADKAKFAQLNLEVPADRLRAKEKVLFRQNAGDQPPAFDGKPRALAEGLDAEQKIQGGMLDRRMVQRMSPMVVREYSHQRTSGERSELRTDFTETLAWFPVLVTRDGVAEVPFDLNDSVTSFVATASAYTLDGRLGSARITLESRLPLVLQPKIPLEVTHGDEVIVPLAITNNTDGDRDAQILLESFPGLKLLHGDLSAKVRLKKGETLRKLYTFTPEVVDGEASLTFSGKMEGFARDAIREAMVVSSAGFPIARGINDTLEGSLKANITLPEGILPGSLKVRAVAYPSVLADLQKGLEALLREPNGCFEQTSTTNYPNLLVMDYIRESNQNLPEVEKRALGLLERGYQKLLSFECNNSQKNIRQGYEWFGGNAAPHEALTAYGLMQFKDLSKVMNVNMAMVKRTSDFLMEQRDGKGGFKRNPRALDTFGRAPAEITDAYIVWSITEAGKDEDVSLELKTLKEKASGSTDPYFLALVANSLINRGDADGANKILKVMVSQQKGDGHFDSQSTSITGSGGRDLQVETTALALLALLKSNQNEYQVASRKTAEWIGKQRGGAGGFGSTQATILALKSLIAFTKANKKTVQSGEVKIFLGEKLLANHLFAAGSSEAMTLDIPQPEKNLQPGDNTLRLELSGGNSFPVTIGWTYNTLKPASEGLPPLNLQAALASRDVSEGAAVQLKVRLENSAEKGKGMATAILGIPAGLSIPEDFKQLKDLCRVPEDGSRPRLAAFEVLGRELVLYWRDLAPREVVELNLDLIARVPGEYAGQASRAYLYYDGAKKHWIEPMRVKIRSGK